MSRRDLRRRSKLYVQNVGQTDVELSDEVFELRTVLEAAVILPLVSLNMSLRRARWATLCCAAVDMDINVRWRLPWDPVDRIRQLVLCNGSRAAVHMRRVTARRRDRLDGGRRRAWLDFSFAAFCILAR